MSALGRLVNTYNSCLNKSPMLTNSVTGFVIAALGDIAVQKYLADEENKQKTASSSSSRSSSSGSSSSTSSSSSSSSSNSNSKKNLDSKSVSVGAAPGTKVSKHWWQAGRTLEMGIIRAAVVAPFVFSWYPFLARTVPGRAVHRVLGRVCLDQALGSPMVVMMVFTASAILQGAGPAAALQRIREKGLTTWIAGLQYWPFVHTINFGFIPSHHQPLFAHVCSLYWNAVLSYYANVKIE